jgi:glycine oxidase
MRYPIIVIGGGVIGLFCARELALNGSNVVLLERQDLGKESSWAGGGILSPLYPWVYPESANVLVQMSQNLYPEVVEALATSTGIDPEWTMSGLLIIDGNFVKNVDKIDELSRYGFERVTGDRLRKLEPALAQEVETGFFREDVAQIRNPRLIAALREDLILRGVKIQEYAEVTGFTHSHGRLSGIQTRQRGELSAEQCVVAAGPWTADLLMTTGLKMPIRPIRGQMLMLRARAELISHVILNDYRYLIPRRDGRVLVGSTFEDVGFNKEITVDAREALLKTAYALIPSLASCPIERHWAGLRPGSPQGVPFIGEHPEISGLYVCAGHYRNGFAQAPASARILVDLMFGRRPLFNPYPYRLVRQSIEEMYHV